MWTANQVKTFVEKFVRIGGKKASLLNWQWERVVKPFYGDGVSQRPKRLSLWCPKKSGKSLLTALICIVHALETERGNVLLCASTVEQAGTIFRFMTDMITDHPKLKARFEVRPTYNLIIDKKTRSRIKLLSGSPKSKAGPNTTLVCIEEAADFAPAALRTVYDQLVYSSMANYGKATFVVLSTAGFEREGHKAYELYQEAVEVTKHPAKYPEHLAIVYSVPDEMDWKNPANWWAYLPSCPEIVPQQFYLDEFAALTQDTLGQSRFRTLLLNQFLGLGHGDSWIQPTDWHNCKIDFKEADLYGKGYKAVGGLDMSRRFDLSSWVLLVEKDNRLYLLPRFFTCRDGLEAKSKADNFPYTLHAANPDANLYLNSGDVIDPSNVRKQILLDCERFKVSSVGFDPAWLSAETQQILEYTHGIQMVELKQTYQTMSPPTLQFERWIRTHKLAHNNNPIMNWCVESARLRISGGLAMIDSKHTRARVDGCQAAACAVQRYLDKAVACFSAI